jgi:predicted metallopeptidase
MHRYEDGNDQLTEVFLDVMEEHFPQLQYLKFKLIFDLKQRVSKGRLVLASIETASPKIKYLSKDNIAIDGYDLLMIVDQKAWEVASADQRVKLIRHELRHVQIDEKGGVKIVGHEIEDFHIEVKLNQDNPEWRMQLATLTHDMYEQEKLMLKENKNG